MLCRIKIGNTYTNRIHLDLATKRLGFIKKLTKLPCHIEIDFGDINVI